MMNPESRQEGAPFYSPEAEIAALRRRIAEQERELEARHERPDTSALVRREVETIRTENPQESVDSSYRLEPKEAESAALDLSPRETDEQVRELGALLEEKGLRNALSVLERMRNPRLEDDFHRFLVQYVKAGHAAHGLKEKSPLSKTLRMTLYEVVLPDAVKNDKPERPLREMLAQMEQFYAGMLSISEGKGNENGHFAVELAVSEGSDDIVFYVSVPDSRRDLFQKQILAAFPDADIFEQKNDYNIFVEGGVSAGSYGVLARRPILPLKTYDQFEFDPLSAIVKAFSKIETHGGGAAIQIILRPVGSKYVQKYRKALSDLQKGVPEDEALAVPEGVGGHALKIAREFVKMAEKKKSKEEQVMHKPPDPILIEEIGRKIAHPILSANLRVAVSARDGAQAESTLSDIESAFNQFGNTRGNNFEFRRLKGGALSRMLSNFSFRKFAEDRKMPLNVAEIVGLFHFPTERLNATPQLKQHRAKTAAVPLSVSHEGTVLGANRYQGSETKVHLSKEDRLRHLYVIGQTGTGKTTLLKNMIAQDIATGEGVCMIDPHGTDIVDVLGMVPEERFSDVIYFDPSYMPRSFALNMLEYDPAYPEQKTFVVNELFSIFQKLYGSVPESMGPMFEQYFRNATQLVLEDPQSGNTLLDVSRVLSDAEFRALKLSRCRNPIVKEFWEGIATKAGGESSLANIVPYITSKFDVFLANDFLRPVIAQEHSSFNFRDIMDGRKILLVNLAKGRLGDINANLIGLILVGKILMAALSRVDASGDSPPFYLYIDEFQNVTTDSISTILSEARKYRLSLTIAHQFIAQISDSIRDAVFGNVGSMAAFRVGSEDAQFLEKYFAPVFDANDLVNVPNRTAFAKILSGGAPLKPFTLHTEQPGEARTERIEELKQRSYEAYGRERETIEAQIQAKYRRLT